jgi:arylsulfatase A-like enzyme
VRRTLPWGGIGTALLAATIGCGRRDHTPPPPLRPPPAETRIDLLQRLAAAEQTAGRVPPRRTFAALQDDIREAVVVRVPATVRFADLPVHPGARLQVALGAARLVGRADLPVSFVVRAAGARGPVELARRSLEAADFAAAAWVELDLPLAEAAAGATRVTLELEATGGDPSVLAAWAWPEVVSDGIPGPGDRTRVTADELQRDLLAELDAADLTTGPHGPVRRLETLHGRNPRVPAAGLVPAGAVARWKLRLEPEHHLQFRYHVGRLPGTFPPAGRVGLALRLRTTPAGRPAGPWQRLAEPSVDLATLEPEWPELRTVEQTVALGAAHTAPLDVELELAGTGPPPPSSVRAALGALVLVRPIDVPRVRHDGPGRNVVVLLADTLGAAHLGLYGATTPTSPELDRRAARGIVFDDARAPVPATVPSVGAMLAGRHPTAEGPCGRRLRLPPQRTTLAEAARRAGWTTAAFVANALLFSGSGFEQGFEEYHDVGFRPAADVSGRAAEWIRAHRDERFLLYVHYLDPHAPYAAPDPWYGMFSPGYAGHVVRNTWDVRREPWAKVVNDAVLRGTPVDAFAEFGENARRARDRVEVGAALLRRLEQLYHGEVRYWDAQLPRVLDALVAAGAWSQTVVAVVADHGEEFAEDGHLGHGFSLDDSAVRVPLVLLGAVPGPPRRVATPVSLVDLAPVLLDLAGIPVPPEMEGRTLEQLEAAPPTPVCSTTLTYVRPERGASSAYQTAVRVRTPALDLLHLVRDDAWFAARRSDHDGSAWRELPATEVPAELRDAVAAFERRLPQPESGARSAEPDAAGQPGLGLDLDSTGGDRELDALRALGYVQ